MNCNTPEREKECDPYVEHLRKKYLNEMNISTSKSSSQTSTEEHTPNDIVSCSPSSSLTESEKRHYNRAMEELKTLLRMGESKLEESVAQYKALKESTGDEQLETPPLSQVDMDSNGDNVPDSEITLTQSVSLPTMSSDFVNTGSYKPRKSVRISLEPTTLRESEFSTALESTWPGPGILRSSSIAQNLEPTDVKVIHAELMTIHKKLNEKNQALSTFQSELQQKEQELLIREESLLDREQQLSFNEEHVHRAHDVMMRLQGVESKVEEKFILLQECHAAEINQLHGELSEKLKECKRLKSSFDTLKLQNDELKVQESELSTLNQKLQTQNQKLKKRLENLQRKYEYNSYKNNANQVLTDQTNKVKLVEKQPSSIQNKSIDKSSKVWSNALEALSISLDWISEVHLRPTANDSKLESLKMCKETIIDKCLKVLPLLVEVIRYLPVCTSQNKHHLSYLRFIYWSLYHLEDTHHALLSSTARRIGEELLKPSAVRLLSDSSNMSTSMCNTSLPYTAATDGKSKSLIFFRSSNVEVRMLSSFIIFKTLHQVDMLAQVFDQLKKDLKEEPNRQYFLHYAATEAVLPYLTYKTNKSLMGSVVDVMLQMAMESSLLPAFLELCSCEAWFRAVSSAVRAIGQSSDNASLEKLSIILQKLSKVKSNRKYFETFSLGRALQERYRECDPGSTFLSLNLRSILFNLNLLKDS